jgi:hypothetical protein
MASAANDALSALAEGLHHASTTLHRILALLEAKAARECLATTRLHAATRGLLAPVADLALGPLGPLP